MSVDPHIAEALRQYAKQAGESLENQNMIAEIKLRAERRAGELIADMPKNEGGRPTEKTPDTVSVVSAPSLADLGISHKQSSRFQAVASIPEPVFEQHIAETKAAGEELTSAGVQRLAQEIKRPHVANNSGNNEWYTPSEHIDAAKVGLLKAVTVRAS